MVLEYFLKVIFDVTLCVSSLLTFYWIHVILYDFNIQDDTLMDTCR